MREGLKISLFWVPGLSKVGRVQWDFRYFLGLSLDPKD